MRVREVFCNWRDFGNPKSEPKKIKVKLAQLNQWSEPKALLRSWLLLPSLAKGEIGVMEVIGRLSDGHDPKLASLLRFMEVCREHEVPIVVENNRGQRPFKIEDNGSVYTPGTKGCPIQRRTGESEQDFWARFDQHRLGCFALTMWEVIDETGLTLEEVVGAFREEEAGLIMVWFDSLMVDRDLAERWAKGSAPDLDDGVAVPEQGEALASGSGRDERISALEAKVDELSNLVSVLLNRIDQMSSGASTSNVMTFKPRSMFTAGPDPVRQSEGVAA